MRCPKCLAEETQVVDSRESDEGVAIRRRRECAKCANRFTTFERFEAPTLRVIKKSGERESFDIAKIKRGIYLAFEKLAVSKDLIDGMLSQIEQEIYNRFDGEVPTRSIGEIVLKHVKKLDKVAYIRFASVYREFVDLADFEKEIQATFKKAKRPEPAKK
jgi:transcriptional repressor NrdR